MKSIFEAIEQKYKDITSFVALGEKLSGTEFNSILLAFFKQRTTKMRATDLVNDFNKNRFVKPSQVNVLAFKMMELEWLRYAEMQSFQPIILSPLTPLGTCSVIGEVSQNNVVSASRGTEVVSDITNVLALKIASDFKTIKSLDTVKYAATHYHVRGQLFENPAFNPHFHVFCLVSGGIDAGSFKFEIEQLAEHLKIYKALLKDVFNGKQLIYRFYLRSENGHFKQLLEPILKEYEATVIEDYDRGDYYQLLQFKIFVKHNDFEINIVDGGLVDWTQKLIPNKKHRLFISGCGIELAHKIQNGII